MRNRQCSNLNNTRTLQMPWQWKIRESRPRRCTNMPAHALTHSQALLMSTTAIKWSMTRNCDVLFSYFFFFLPIHELLCFELVLRAILFGGTTRNDKKNSPLFWKSKVPPTTFKSKLWSRRLVNTLFATQSEKKIWEERSNQKAELSVCLIFVHWLHLLPLLTKTDNMHFLPGLFKIISCVLYTHTEWKERASPFYITFFFPLQTMPKCSIFLTTSKTLCLRSVFPGVL